MRFKNPHATLALGLLFGSIWAGDVICLPYLDAASSVVFMRLTSLGVYLVYLAISVAWLKGRHQRSKTRVERARHTRRFITTTGIISLAAYFAGMALIFKVPALAQFGFVLTKLVGAPLSVGAVYLLGSPGREGVAKSIALAVCLSFLIFAFGSYLATLDFVSNWALGGAAGALLIISLYCTDQSLRTVDELIGAQDLRHETPETITRSLRQIMNWPLVAGLVLVSLMLGFVRHGLSEVNPPDALMVVILVAVILVGIGLWRRSLSMGFFFQAGMLCLACAVLLSPLLSLMSVPMESLLLWASSVFLETVAITLCAWTTHNSNKAFFAAVVSRTIMVLGHLLGTLLVEAESLLALRLPEGSSVASSVLVLIFLLLLLFSYRIPTLQVLFFSLPPNDFDTAESPENQALHSAAQGLRPDEIPNADEVMAKEESWRDMRKRSCKHIANVYKLTEREIDVLYELSEGRSVGYMADRFVLSQNTIKMHVRHIYQKLDVHSKQELIDVVNAADAQGAAQQEPAGT